MLSNAHRQSVLYWCLKLRQSRFRDDVGKLVNEPSYLLILGPEEARPVYWVVLLQHPEAGHQPPAEVFSLSTSPVFTLPVTWDPAPTSPPPPVLSMQRLWGSAVSPKWSERHVAVEAEVWAPRSGFSSHRRYHAPALREKAKQKMFTDIQMCSSFSDAITAVGSFSLKANELLQWVLFCFCSQFLLVFVVCS